MPKKKYRYFSFLISEDMESALKSASIARDRSASWIIKKAVGNYIKFKEPTVNPKPRKKT